MKGCEGALLAGAYERMMGGDPTVRSSVKAAWKHINSLIEWVFVKFFAGFLTNIIGPLTNIIGPLTWRVAT